MSPLQRLALKFPAGNHIELSLLIIWSSTSCWPVACLAATFWLCCHWTMVLRSYLFVFFSWSWHNHLVLHLLLWCLQLQLQKTQYLQLGQNRGQYYGGSLPNVNQIGNSTIDVSFQVRRLHRSSVEFDIFLETSQWICLEWKVNIYLYISGR